MSVEAWFSIAVVGGCVALLASNKYSPDLVLMAGLTLMIVSGIVSPEEALIGFSNESMITVVSLYIVVTGFRETGESTGCWSPCWGIPGR